MPNPPLSRAPAVARCDPGQSAGRRDPSATTPKTRGVFVGAPPVRGDSTSCPGSSAPAAASRPSVSALRQLLAERFPTVSRGPAGAALHTGLPALDGVAGGLPQGALTEIVCAAPSCGGQLVIGQLLHATRREGLRLALIDGVDSFDPHAWPEDWLVHLVWVRCRSLAEAMQAADIIVRDANFGLVVLDLRDLAVRDVQRLPSRDWYRLQRAAEQNGLTVVVETPAIAVPSAALRLVLSQPHGLAAQTEERGTLAARLEFERQRERVRERDREASAAG